MVNQKCILSNRVRKLIKFHKIKKIVEAYEENYQSSVATSNAMGRIMDILNQPAQSGGE